MGPEIAAGVAGMAGPVLQYFGQREANYSNMEMADNANRLSEVEAGRNRAFQQASAREAMDFSSAQAQKQMDFQERMSNSAYQRATADMKKAGLNPILMANQSGASTPSGASGSGSSASGSQASYTAARLENTLTGFATAAKEIQDLRAGSEAIRNLRAQRGKTEAERNKILIDAGLSKAQIKKLGVDTDVAKKGIPESEIKNDAMDIIIRPLLEKLKNYIKSPSPKEPNKSPEPKKNKLYDSVEELPIMVL